MTKSIFFGLLLVAASVWANEEKIAVKGMHCEACESELNDKVCKDKEMSTWFSKCEAKVLDAKAEMGEIKFTPKSGNLTADQQAKITAAIKGTGREVVAAASAKATPKKK